ncbi:CRISPR-associated helicase Cas3' [Streptomonospora sp. S1-112]|uniref:CRISPR-associated helicase Cas3 n=1 Tax=Streptomonospora mangrovi TaxID=2883123 RepID=A0A9X3NHZ9_9ACTN|nr:CRISPR-associated helicase Cas3' [Streptomonospora mangrovi]MDA0564154.1 CRISPR-associated helicase Cas3' [Streptomonospora mangrovi]
MGATRNTGQSAVDLRIWGKARGLGDDRYPVVCHLLDAAAVMRVLWRDSVSPGLRAAVSADLGVSEPEAGRLLELWAGLHDIGKITPSFQQQVAVPAGYPLTNVDQGLPHDVAGGRWLASALREAGYPDERRKRVAKLVAQVVGGHHGCFHEPHPAAVHAENRAGLGLGEGPWDEQREAAFAALRVIVEAPDPPPAMSPHTAAVVCGLVILADWLVSQIPYIKQRLPDVPASGDIPRLRTFFEGSLLQAPGLLADAGLGRLRLRPGGFSEEFPFAPNALQSSVTERLPSLATGPGLLMIAAPMGMGKTETAFHAARVMGEAAGTSGTFVALPTTATADQMYSRFADYLARRSDHPAPLTLLHSMAWLSPVYTLLDGSTGTGGESTDDIASHDLAARVAATEWLRGAKRGLLAQAAVGTVDQALLAVLPLRHNTVRMSALAQKTVVIDEVHAFDPYMRDLLCVLLRWLGRLGAPVVLLSATLPRHVARELCAAYLGGGADALGRASELELPYPGWAYVQRDMAASVTTSVPVADRERRSLAVTLAPVAIAKGGEVDRMPRLQAELAALLSHGGCAAVICTTVDHAQATYRALRDWFAQERAHGRPAPELRLLHSRFPARQRERITEEVIAAYGKGGDRSTPSVLVATQVIEQSLDVDFDLIITDLAPFELLLQRAGRGHRHPVNDAARPAWARTPRMVVLTAPGGDTPRVPQVWRYVYPHAALVRAQRLLERRGQEPIVIPDDVQGLVDAANPGERLGAADPLLEGYETAELESLAAVMVKRQSANLAAIDTPEKLKRLHRLTARDLSEDVAGTRFDADSQRVLPCFVDAEGTYRLGGFDGEELPRPTGEGRLTRDQRAAVMHHTVPVRGSLLTDRSPALDPPEEWSTDPLLGRLVLLPHTAGADGGVRGPAIGDRLFTLDPEEGLLIRRR